MSCNSKMQQEFSFFNQLSSKFNAHILQMLHTRVIFSFEYHSVIEMLKSSVGWKFKSNNFFTCLAIGSVWQRNIWIRRLGFLFLFIQVSIKFLPWAIRDTISYLSSFVYVTEKLSSRWYPHEWLIRLKGHEKVKLSCYKTNNMVFSGWSDSL